MTGTDTKYEDRFAQHARDELNRWMGDMTEAEAAEKLGVNQSTVHRNRKPHNQPTFSFLIRLSKVTGKSIDALIGLTTEPPKAVISDSQVMRITKAIVEEVRKKDSNPPPPLPPKPKKSKKPGPKAPRKAPPIRDK